MESSWPENLPTDRKKAIEKLIRGRELATQLQFVLSKSFKNDGSACAGDLVMKILVSFTDTLSLLNPIDSDEVSQIPAKIRMGSLCWDGRRSEDSGESTKTSALKDRRGCYKRRKTSQTSTIVTPTLIDDGRAWRKYGQKVILNAKHPRNYYRCTHKFDQSCQATKQVQLTEDEPPKFRTTYHGHHTCKSLLKAPQIILDSTDGDSSFLLSFQSNDSNGEEPNDQFLPSNPYVKQEYKENSPSFNHNRSSPDYLFFNDHPTTFESSGPMSVLSSGSDHGDVISSGVYSCTASTHSFEMDHLMVGDFDDVLGFEFC